MSPVVKKRGEKFTIPSKYLLFVLTLFCTVTMLMTFSTDIFNKPLNTVVGYLVVPFQKGISSAGEWLSTRAQDLKDIRELKAENEELKKQLADLLAENIELQQGKYELNQLQALYNIDEQYSGYEKTGARIIARDSGNWYHSFTIDKGSDDGIAANMNVLAGGGLVGRVYSVGPNWAKVVSIINDNNNVSGKILATGDNLIVSGDLELMQKNLIRFSQLLDSDAIVTNGDKIVTSDISDKYLPGILIGYINEINVDSNKLTKSGTVIPAVDFEHLSEVLVIKQLKQTVSD